MNYRIPFVCPLPDGIYSTAQLLALCMAETGQAHLDIDNAYQLTLVRKETPCAVIQKGVCIGLCAEGTQAPPSEPTKPLMAEVLPAPAIPKKTWSRKKKLTIPE